MKAKMIFFNLPDGDETMQFCPLDCEHCFFPKHPQGCTGEYDKYCAFELIKVGEDCGMRPIETSKLQEASK